MAKLPPCSGKEAIKAFERADWTVDRQKGSHVTLVKPGFASILTVPLHDELGRGLLRSLITKAQITEEEFLDLL